MVKYCYKGKQMKKQLNLVKATQANTTKSTLKTISKWMYNWWGIRHNYTLEEMQQYMLHCLNESKLPQTYILYNGKTPIGLYQYLHTDLRNRPDVYPWLGRVYVTEKQRGKGYCRFMLESVKQTAKELGVDEIYLYTQYVGLYEKFGWTFEGLIDTYKPDNRMHRFYTLNLKD